MQLTDEALRVALIGAIQDLSALEILGVPRSKLAVMATTKAREPA
jgi:hypothetical protein